MLVRIDQVMHFTLNLFVRFACAFQSYTKNVNGSVDVHELIHDYEQTMNDEVNQRKTMDEIEGQKK